MKYIEKITIRYFRSLHTIEVKQCKSVNVISGRNDVGKSNETKGDATLCELKGELKGTLPFAELKIKGAI
jgi:predicted ATPase